MLINPISVFLNNSLLSILRPYFMQGSKPLILGVVFLAITREFLLSERLFDYNTPAMLQYGRPCTPREIKYRTYDGHCNNLNQTAMGMTFKRFGRSAVKDIRKPGPGLFDPDPYVVAEKLLKSPDGTRQTADPYNIFFLAWINLNIHDWVHHDKDLTKEPYILRWGPKTTDTFRLGRTVRDSEGFTINTETPWWDGSQIYGKTEEQASRLRVANMCELRLDERGNMPLGANGVPLAGFNENWWVGVEVLHHLIVLEHNYVCGMLRASYTTMPEDDLYETARLIIAALFAQIHTTEWTPALLYNDLLNVSMHQNWEGLSQSFKDYEMAELKGRKDSLTAQLGKRAFNAMLDAASNFVIGTKGVGHKTELSGVPYSLSEDFVSAYRLHPLIPEAFEIAGEKVKAEDTLFAKARKVINKFGMETLVDSWGHQPPMQLVMQNYPNFLTRVNISGDTSGEQGMRNMAAVDVFRDRERGMVRYNEARRQYGLPAAKTFQDITDNKEWAAALKSVYKSVDDVDFLVGCLAESPRPKGYAISNVQFYIFIINASRRLLCDRFYQESFNADTYTAKGITHVQTTTFKKMLLRHYPGLAESMGDVSSAFLKWTGPRKFSSKAA